jgi:hypothetical protein
VLTNFGFVFGLTTSLHLCGKRKQVQAGPQVGAENPSLSIFFDFGIAVAFAIFPTYAAQL